MKQQKSKFKKTEIGMIPEDWEVCDLGNKLEISKISINPSKYPKKTFHLYSIPAFDNNMVPEKKLGSEIRSSKFKVESSSILFPKLNLRFKRVWKIKEPSPNSICSTEFIPVKPKNSDFNFIYYLLESRIILENLEKMAAGTSGSHQRIKSNLLFGLRLGFPPLPEQKSIAHILSTLDENIELLQKQNKTLEEIGQAIFKRWFVDFEFPDENGNPYKSSAGKMVYNKELGKEIPEGWSVDKMENYIDLDKGLSYKGSGLTEETEKGLPMANLGTFNLISGFKKEGLKYYEGEYKNRNLVKPGDLIIANTDMTQNREILGSPAIVPYEINSDKVLFTHHTYAVRHLTNKISNYFLYFLFQTPDYRERAISFATGTTVLALPQEAILRMEFLMPPERIMKSLNFFLESFFGKISVNNQQIQTLSQIRDSLLPKLMSGKIRVPVEYRG